MIPCTPLAEVLGFTPLRASFLAFVLGATLTYLLLVETVKPAVFRLHQQSLKVEDLAGSATGQARQKVATRS